MMVNSLYVFEKTPNLKTRFDVVGSTGRHDFLETILVNKRNPNPGGLSLYLVDRPKKFIGGDAVDKAITKGEFNISSIYVPNPEIPMAYGDINGTNDALLFIFNCNTLEGVTELEMYIAPGQKHNKKNLYFLLVDHELDDEMEALRESIRKR